jgi:hypothetical protein
MIDNYLEKNQEWGKKIVVQTISILASAHVYVCVYFKFVLN